MILFFIIIEEWSVNDAKRFFKSHFINRLVTVSGQVVLMHHGGRYGRYPFHNNTRMLLRDLMIEGQPIDHIGSKSLKDTTIKEGVS